MQLSEVDYRDIQGLVRFGYGHLTRGALPCWCRSPTPRRRARGSAANRGVTNAVAGRQAADARCRSPSRCEGLRKLGVRRQVLEGFSLEFQRRHGRTRTARAGSATSATNDPERWHWGGAGQAVSARPDHALRGGRRSRRTGRRRSKGALWEAAFTQVYRLSTSSQERSRAVRLRRRRQPAAARLERAASRRGCATPPNTPTCRRSANSCSAIRTSTAATPTVRCSMPQDDRARRPAARRGRARQARFRPQRHLSGVARPRAERLRLQGFRRATRPATIRRRRTRSRAPCPAACRRTFRSFRRGPRIRRRGRPGTSAVAQCPSRWTIPSGSSRPAARSCR